MAAGAAAAARAATLPRSVPGGRGGATLVVFATLMIGYLYLSGRLRRVWDAALADPASPASPAAMGGSGPATGGSGTATMPMPMSPAPTAGPARIIRIPPPAGRPGAGAEVRLSSTSMGDCRRLVTMVATQIGYTPAQAAVLAWEHCVVHHPVWRTWGTP